jgi:hypothetical protein
MSYLLSRTMRCVSRTHCTTSDVGSCRTLEMGAFQGEVGKAPRSCVTIGNSEKLAVLSSTQRRPGQNPSMKIFGQNEVAGRIAFRRFPHVRVRRFSRSATTLRRMTRRESRFLTIVFD